MNILALRNHRFTLLFWKILGQQLHFIVIECLNTYAFDKIVWYFLYNRQLVFADVTLLHTRLMAVYSIECVSELHQMRRREAKVPWQHTCPLASKERADETHIHTYVLYLDTLLLVFLPLDHSGSQV